MRQPEGGYLWQLDLDFSDVPINADTMLVINQITPSDAAEQVGREGKFYFTITDDTGLVRIWMLMPEGRPYEKFEISGFRLAIPSSQRLSFRRRRSICQSVRLRLSN